MSYNYSKLTFSSLSLFQNVSLPPSPTASKAVLLLLQGSSRQGWQQEEGAYSLPHSQLCYLVGQTRSLCASFSTPAYLSFCLFFKMLKTYNKKQIQNAVINSQFQANPASLLINLNTWKKNNKFCPSLVLRWSLLYTVCVCVYVCGKCVYIYIYFPLFPIQGGAE